MNYLLEGEEVFEAISLFSKKLFVPFEGNDYRPWFLQSRILLCLVIFILVAKIVSVGIFLPIPKNIFFADITKIELLNLLNQSRQEHGLPSLTENSVLDRAAYLKAKDMIANDYFSHQSPEGVKPWFWFKQAGYEYKYAGENLAVGFADSSFVYSAWFNSPSHKDNLLNNHYQEVGTAVVEGFGPNGSIVVVQLFGSPLVKASPAPKNKNVQNIQKIVVEPKAQVSPESVNNITAEGELETVVAQNNETLTEENVSIVARVLSESTEYSVLSEPSNNTGNSFYFAFLHFIVYDNNRILQMLSYGLLAIISICLIINISINFQIQRKDLILRSLTMLAILYVSTFIDKEFILQLMPNQILI